MSRLLDKEFRQVFLTGALLSIPVAVVAAVVTYKVLGGPHARTH